MSGYTYHKERHDAKLNQLRLLIKEARMNKMWIWQKRTKNWWTPDEFENAVFKVDRFHWTESDEWVIADPILAIKQADAFIADAVKKRDAFNNKILKYYQQPNK